MSDIISAVIPDLNNENQSEKNFSLLAESINEEAIPIKDQPQTVVESEQPSESEPIREEKTPVEKDKDKAPVEEEKDAPVEEEKEEAPVEEEKDDKTTPQNQEEEKPPSVTGSVDVSNAPSDFIADLQLLEETEQNDDEGSFILEEVPEETDEPTETKKKKKKRKPRRASGDTIETLQLVTETVNIDGDFAALGKERTSFSSLVTEGDEVSEEEEQEVQDEGKAEEIEEKKVVPLTVEERTELYDEFEQLEKDLQEEKIKNNIVLKKLAMYYQKRNMLHVLQEGKNVAESNRRYEKLLDDFELFSKNSQKEVQDKQNEMQRLKASYATQLQEVDEYFKKFQKLEFDLGKEIISSEAGRKFDEKFIERYLKRQKIQQNNLTKIRLDYIKIRNKVTTVQNALISIDNLGSDLRLMDYEQLKHDNRQLKDKMEEKELELTLIRKKCQNCAQILAHRREKTAALDVDIESLKEQFEDASGEFEDIRAQITMVKQERDSYRRQTGKLKLEAGLLFQNKLLDDLSRTIDEKEEIACKVEEVKKDYKKVCRHLKKLQKSMDSSHQDKKDTESSSDSEKGNKSVSN